MKYIVAKHKAHAIVANKFLANNKGLCQTIGRGLHGIFKVYAKFTAISQQALEARHILWR